MTSNLFLRRRCDFVRGVPFSGRKSGISQEIIYIGRITVWFYEHRPIVRNFEIPRRNLRLAIFAHPLNGQFDRPSTESFPRNVKSFELGRTETGQKTTRRIRCLTEGYSLRCDYPEGGGARTFSAAYRQNHRPSVRIK